MQDGTTSAGGENTLDSAATFLETLITQVTPFALSAIGALAVLIAGLWLAGRIKKVFIAFLNRSNRLDKMLESFLASLVYYGLVVLVVVTTLGVFGVPTTSFAAVIGAAGLAIGLALQGTLGHVASGVMLLGFRPFKVGDFVEVGGYSGTIKAMTLFTTELATPDNKKIILPNGNVWDNAVVNFGAYGTRRVDLVFGVSYSDDLDKAIGVIRKILSEEDRIHADPAPVVEVDALGDSSVNILCRPWVDASNYFPVKWSLTKRVKEAFDENDVSIPFPTRTIVQEKPESDDRAAA